MAEKGKVMGSQGPDAWDYIDPARKESKKYAKAAEEALSEKNYSESIRNYEQAANVIKEMLDNLNEKHVNMYGAKIASANTLKIDREGYLEKIENLRKKEKRKDSGLLKKLGLGVIVLLFAASLFFFQSSFTGNVIGNLNPNISNWIGAGLFVIGMIGTFVYFRRR